MSLDINIVAIVNFESCFSWKRFDCRYCKPAAIMLSRSKSLSFPLFCSLIIIVPFSIATTIPYPSKSEPNTNHRYALIAVATFANSTRIAFPDAAETTGCPTHCSREVGPLGSVTWTSKTISATVTAETLVYVVNKKNNNTRTETITNTEVNLKDYTPLTATKTTSVTLKFGTTSRTEILQDPCILLYKFKILILMKEPSRPCCTPTILLDTHFAVHSPRQSLESQPACVIHAASPLKTQNRFLATRQFSPIRHIHQYRIPSKTSVQAL